nr:MAG TPA_asm: hypothetical protein [Caudoviricetes sp.]
MYICDVKQDEIIINRRATAIAHNLFVELFLCSYFTILAAAIPSDFFALRR